MQELMSFHKEKQKFTTSRPLILWSLTSDWATFGLSIKESTKLVIYATKW